MNSFELIQFMRKFLVQISDFTFGQKEVAGLGHAFFHFSFRQLMQKATNNPMSVRSGIMAATKAVSRQQDLSTGRFD